MRHPPAISSNIIPSHADGAIANRSRLVIGSWCDLWS